MAMTIEDLFPELLLKIFSNYIESEGHEEFSKDVVPVCSTWWKLSTTPSLWKIIRVENWDYVVSLSNRGLLTLTESLRIPGDHIWPQISIDSNCLLAVLSNIRYLKSLEISCYFIDVNTMTIVAEHCPNLERLYLNDVSCTEYDMGDITLKELGPILNICGPKLKYLHLTCVVEDSEEMISEIAAKCMSLEVLEWGSSYFPIYKIMRGCPRLQKLELKRSTLVTTGENDCCGFENLTVFAASYCNFRGLDVCSLLKKSNNLEHLQLRWSRNFIFSDVSKIPSNKVKFFEARFRSVSDINFVALELAVDKWKNTLMQLIICGWQCNFTGVIKSYIDGNQCPKLEFVNIGGEKIHQNLLKTFLEKCQNLNEFYSYENSCKNREKVLKLIDSL